MNKETVKTIVIILLSVIFVSHSIVKKVTVDELEEENTTLKLRVSLMKYTKEIADSLMFDTTQHALDLAARLATFEKKIKVFLGGYIIP